MEKYFIFTEEEYKKKERCYYCKTTKKEFPWIEINKNGYGCDNCRNYALNNENANNQAKESI